MTYLIPNRYGHLCVFYNIIIEKNLETNTFFDRFLLLLQRFPHTARFFTRNERMGGNVYIHKRRY